MARQEGLEPPTFWFVAKHSIQLSYWRIGLFSNSLLIIAGLGRKVKPFLKFFETLSRKAEGGEDIHRAQGLAQQELTVLHVQSGL